MKKYLITLVVVCALVVVPFVSHASIISDLWQQIYALQARIAVLLARKPVSTVPDFVVKTCQYDTRVSVHKCGNYYNTYDLDLMDAPSYLYDSKANFVASCGGMAGPDSPISNPICHLLTSCSKDNLCDKKMATSTIDDCPKLMPPSPNFCSNGKIVYPGKDAKGCQPAPKCENIINASSNQTLINFFNYLSLGNYNSAVGLIDLSEPFQESKLGDRKIDGWEFIAQFSEERYRSNHAKVLENYCRAVGTCLKIRNVISQKYLDDGTYEFMVQFTSKDGSLYKQGPCCGASEIDQPTKTEFSFKVKNINGVPKVITYPLYRP